jgi:hypothetical protein
VSNGKVLKVFGRVWDSLLFKVIMSTPEGPRHYEYARDLRRYVSSLADEDRVFILSHRDEVYDAHAEWMELNESVLLRLGFDETEARNLHMNRLNSPGMRHVIQGKADEMHGCGFNVALSRKIRELPGMRAVCERYKRERRIALGV